jgi:hypothetical protein
MNERRSSKLWTIAILVIAGSVLAAAALQEGTGSAQVKPKPEKLCPITFHLDPTTSLQTRFARDVEETNAKLAQTLVDLRNNLMPPKDWVRVDLSAACGKRFAGTYLANPVLWDEKGNPHTGWFEPDGILAYLEPIMRTATYIHPQTVNVYLEYLPLANQTGEFLHKRGVVASGFEPEEIDFLVNIRTVIAYAPYDAPLEIGNAAPIPHRKICDPIY